MTLALPPAAQAQLAAPVPATGARVRLSDEVLRCVRGLAARATPGPWRPSRANCYGAVVAPGRSNDCRCCERLGCTSGVDDCDTAYGGRLIAESCRREDGAFIATIDPQLVTAMVDEIDRLRAFVSVQTIKGEPT